MREMMGPEGAAWARVQTPSPRGRYEHAQAYARRTAKQTGFRQRVKRNPATGCWLWVGQTVRGPNGYQYPVFYHRRESGDSDNTTRSAFPWMMREWFPEVEVLPYRQTTTTCGVRTCISPYHRKIKIPNAGTAQARMDHHAVLEVYALQDSGRTQADVGAEFNIHASTVHKIWHGITWSTVTGHGQDDPSRSRIMSAKKAMEIYQERLTGRTATEVAEEFGVGRTTVTNIWQGLAWTNITRQPKVKPNWRPRLSSYKRRKVLMARGKMSAYAAAKELKVGRTTVLTIWRREEQRLLREQGA